MKNQNQLSASPAPTALFFFPFSIFFFFTISFEPEIYFTRLQRGCRTGREKGHIGTALFFSCKRHRNSLRIWLGNTMSASGDRKRTLRLSELAWQGHVRPDSICCFVTLAFCYFKWLHIILYLHVPWLFPFNLFQLIYSIDVFLKAEPWLVISWHSKRNSKLEAMAPALAPRESGSPKQPPPLFLGFVTNSNNPSISTVARTKMANKKCCFVKANQVLLIHPKLTI